MKTYWERRREREQKEREQKEKEEQAMVFDPETETTCEGWIIKKK